MKTALNVLTAVTLLLFTTSCKIKRTKEVSGVVVNRANQKVLSDVKIELKDGLSSDGFLDFGGTGPENIVTTFTDANGRFNMKIKTSAGSGFITAYKDGYTQRNSDGGTTIQGISFEDKTQETVLEMDGRAYFNAIFKKTSATPKENDELIIVRYAVGSSKENQYNTTKYKGKGPFTYWDDKEGYPVIGDRYLRYKIEASGGSSFTKIDSVFIPTSMTPFRDTIYY